MLKWISGLFVLVMLSPLFAGVVFEIEVKDKSGPEQKIEKMTVLSEGKNVRMNMVDQRDGKNSVIFNGDKRAMIVLDHSRKSYFVMDKATMKAMMGQLNAALGEMQNLLKDLPADQAAMAEKMMKEKMGQNKSTKTRTSTEVRKYDETKDHNGYEVVKFEVFKNDKKTREMWVTDWDNVDGGKDIAQAFTEMGLFFQEMMDEFSSANLPVDFTSQIDDNMFNMMNELEGFPVVTKEFNRQGKVESASSLRSTKRVSLSASDFQPPADYKPQEMGSQKPNMFDR